MFSALYSNSITLNLISENNLEEVYSLFKGYEDSEEMIAEIAENYLPKYEDGRRMTYGFYSLLGDKLAGLSLLGVDNWKEKIGFTGADTLMHMRGQGIAPMSKPHIFFLGFKILGMNRLESGCLVSNISSKRSIEKTKGFQFEGVSRKSGLNMNGEFEDQYIYAILKEDWLKFYDKSQIRVID